MRGGGLTDDRTCDQLLPTRQTVWRLRPHGEGLKRWDRRPAALLPQSPQSHVVLPHSFSCITATHLYRCLPNTTVQYSLCTYKSLRVELVTKLEKLQGLLIIHFPLTHQLLSVCYSLCTGWL